ncbi:hypothetical protein [Aliiruegeria sabulilitoris]|uniref:hypothetical protein n=1 Tax=Aliiruegeria sabulilitoris TaxID=1510458 RepID=UPI0012E38699|nr:hypothetical protein [Aliiruegeria sabulilitoris]NDR58616.1 hypothetical protein [Pseudoruegeria sp. M32A2M]
MTVSYGTFSCTLEGFDDSFGTMKAIAEYFRNLAAEDRYFGAEPPTPDAEMLQRIVEKEIHRRVEARVSEQGITLKAAEDDGAAPVSQPEPAPSIAQASQAEEAPQTETVGESPVEPAEQEIPAVAEPQEASVADEPAGEISAVPAELETPSVAAEEAPVETAAQTVAEPEPLSEPATVEPVVAAPFIPAPAPAESLADKLARIRAVVARSRQVEEIKAQEPPAEVSLPEPTEEALSTAPEQTDMVVDEAPHVTMPEPMADLPVVETESEELPSAIVEELAEIEATPEEGTAETEMAAPFEDALVEEIVAEIDNSPDLVEPEAAAEDTLEADEPPAYEEETPRSNVIRVRKQSLMASLRAALSDKEDEAAVNDDMSVPDPVETADAVVDMPMPEQPVSLDVEETFEPETLAAEEIAADYASEPLQRPEPSAPSLSADAEADLLRELEAVEREMAADSAEIAELEAESQAEALQALEGQSAPAATESASLEKELSALAFASHSAFAEPVTGVDGQDDADEVIADDAKAEISEEAEEPVETVAVTATEEASAPIDDAADDQLAEAIAKVTQTSENEARAEAAAERRARALGQEQDENHNVSRLMDEADNKLAGPELRRRRSAIEHLKAAVAATKAEGPRNRNDDGDTLPYRDDLRAAVGTALQSSKSDAEAALPKDVELAAQEAADRLDFTAIKQGHEAQQPEPENATSQPSEPVRPRRPARSETRDKESRPSTTSERPKVAPLMLVSEQRVDDDAEEKPREPAGAQAVRPRRVTAGRMVSATAEKAPSDNAPEVFHRSSMVSSDSEAAGIFAQSTTFEEFSEQMGARGLEEMLECAAAYTSYVQGRTHFSHPEIMDVVRQAEGQEDLRREDSLRSFGQLLRQGKIQKLDRGQFTLSQASRYNPEQRSVAL